MDKKQIEALQNLAYAFEDLINQMAKRTEAEADPNGPPVMGFFKTQARLSTTLKFISKGIKKIGDDTKKILSGQESLLTMSKEIKDAKEKKNIFSRITDKDNKSKVKDGVKVIILMAGAILAIGAAFLLIGKVDFVSVMALAFALPLVAIAFGKIAEQKELSGKEIFKVLLTVVGISAAIALSSFFFSMIRPLSIPQFITAIGIAAAFAVISFGIGKLAKDLGKTTMKTLAILPLVLIGIAGAITGSSFILQYVQPIGDDILISIVKLSLALGIASLALLPSIWLLGKIDIEDMIMGSLALVVLSGAIMLSSLLLNFGKYETYPGLGWTIGVGAALLLFSLPMIVLGFIAASGAGAIALLAGAVAIVGVAATIVAVSYILSAGVYDTHPTLGWTIGAGAALLLFSIPIVILGAIAASGIGAIALLAGAIAILGVASTIVGVSHILSQGKYDTYPGLGWALGVGLSLVAFGTGMAVLGGIIVATFGLGALALAAGSDAVKTIAQTIVDVSHILTKGTYKGGPTKAWAEGIGLALGAFSPVYSALMQSQVLSIFGGKAMTGDEYGGVMVSIAKSIIEVAKVFNKSGLSVWANAPTKAWSEGVGTAIGAFAPVFAAIDSSIGDRLMDAIFGKEDKVQMMLQAMMASAMGIIMVGNIFSKSKTQYVGGPSKEWAAGVGGSIRAFAEVYAILEEEDIDDASDIIDLNGALFAIVDSIKKVSTQFPQGKIISSPIDPDFMKNIRSNVEEFVGLTKYLEENTISGVGAVAIVSHVKTILAIAKAYDVLGQSLVKLNNAITSLKGNQLENVKMISQNILVINKDETGQDQIVSIPMPKGSSNNVSQPTQTNTQSSQGNSEMTGLLQEMNRKLGVIASNSSNLSSYVNELRTNGDVSLKH